MDDQPYGLQFVPWLSKIYLREIDYFKFVEKVENIYVVVIYRYFSIIIIQIKSK